MDLPAQIIQTTAWILNRLPNQLSRSTHLKYDLQLDSIDLTLLIVKLEEHFKVMLSAQEIDGIETIADLQNKFQAHLS